MKFVTGEVVDGVALPPPELADLLHRPLVAFLATTRPDGTLQCNPMWYSFGNGVIRLSHTSDRQKLLNMRTNPNVSMGIADPGNLFRYVEVRGEVTGTEVDRDAEFHRMLRFRYGMPNEPIPDADRRVVVTVTPRYIGGREMADPTREDATDKAD